MEKKPPNELVDNLIAAAIVLPVGIVAYLIADHFGIDFKARPMESFKIIGRFGLEVVTWLSGVGLALFFIYEFWQFMHRRMAKMELVKSPLFNGFMRVTLVVSIIAFLIGFIAGWAEHWMTGLLAGLLFGGFPWIIFGACVFIALGFKSQASNK